MPVPASNLSSMSSLSAGRGYLNANSMPSSSARRGHMNANCDGRRSKRKDETTVQQTHTHGGEGIKSWVEIASWLKSNTLHDILDRQSFEKVGIQKHGLAEDGVDCGETQDVHGGEGKESWEEILSWLKSNTLQDAHEHEILDPQQSFEKDVTKEHGLAEDDIDCGDTQEGSQADQDTVASDGTAVSTASEQEGPPTPSELERHRTFDPFDQPETNHSWDSNEMCCVWVPIVYQTDCSYHPFAVSEQTAAFGAHPDLGPSFLPSSNQLPNGFMRWDVDEKQIQGNSRSFVSPHSCFVTLAESSMAAEFKLIVQPKGARSFGRSMGRSSITLKCETDLTHATSGEMQFTINVGGETRGPFTHDFASHALGELPLRESIWELRDAVDPFSKRVAICAQVMPVFKG